MPQVMLDTQGHLCRGATKHLILGRFAFASTRLVRDSGLSTGQS